MAGIGYSVTIGSLQASSKPRQGQAFVRAITSELTMDGAGGRCTLELVPSDSALPGPGEVTTISLDGGDGAATVFTGIVLESRAAPDVGIISGGDALAKLARLDVSGAYEQMSAGSIVRELVNKAGGTPGTIEDGPTFPSYVLHRGPRALRHIHRLAEQSGFDVFTDGQGKVHFAKPKTGSADHSFVYRTQVLRTELRKPLPVIDGFEVWGEGAASSQGTAKAHWLVEDLSPIQGKAALGDDGAVRAGATGQRSREVKDGAVRSGDDASTQAKARVAALGARPLHGFIEVLGAPAVKPGDLVEVSDIPAGHPVEALLSGEVLRVRTVRHTLNARTGFTTRMEL
ncbi:hypothetical protein LZ198_11600 [Myxococcus sp. K15C18031901]|uniref:hypothetical protein n=1 Tax=Myxococcus dinghuensis TaxID=2906761 RepID=UPI0020A81E4E|nr:hypothetical protein [Myxococcus dinghuensis]MCP3099514.1 hypothetical protein [Myxococcus dinghuensis]